MHINIVPDYMIGHSIGELICEYVGGRFTTEETILMAYYIGIALQQSEVQVLHTCIHLLTYRVKRSSMSR